jgi:GNAT superfamily N-acetyltransferase
MIVERIQRANRRYGLTGVLRLAGQSVLRRLLLRETHVWYRLDLSGEPPQLQLRPGLELVSAAGVDLPLLEQLPMGGRHGTATRLEMGAGPWIVREGARAVFGCWVFPDRAPVAAARGGAIPLPSGTACIDDVVTMPEYRGQGIAPAALATIASQLRERGTGALVSKIEETNVASRRAFEKAEFLPVTRMHSMRIGPLIRLRVPPGGDGFASFLAARCAEASVPRANANLT